MAYYIFLHKARYVWWVMACVCLPFLSFVGHEADTVMQAFPFLAAVIVSQAKFFLGFVVVLFLHDSHLD